MKGIQVYNSYNKVKPIQASFLVDLSAAWKILIHLSTTKMKIYSCYCYSILSDELVYFKMNNNSYTYCIERNNS